MLNILYKSGKFLKHRYNLIYAFIFAWTFNINIYSFIYMLKCVGRNVIIGLIICKVATYLMRKQRIRKLKGVKRVTGLKRA